MSVLDGIGEGLRAINALIGEAQLLADPSRDWTAARDQVKRLRFVASDEVLGQLDEALKLTDANERAELQAVVVHLVGWAAGVVAASGGLQQARELLERASAHGQPEQRARLLAAKAHLDWWMRLTQAHQLAGTHRRASKALLKSVEKNAPAPELRAAATAMLARPEPLTSAPTLYTLNGFGTALYGARDPHPDGSHVATLYLTAVFIPLFPLGSYRVVNHRNGSYTFLGKVPPARWQRLYRRGLAASAALMIAYLAGVAYLEAPDRLAGIALEAARQAEQAGRTEAALESYGEVFQKYALTDAAPPAVAAYVALKTTAWKADFALDQVPEAVRISKLLQGLPREARSDAARQWVPRLAGWAEALGSATPEKTLGALALLEHAQMLANKEEAKPLEKKERQLRRGIAERLAGQWPLLAFQQYVQLRDAPSFTAAAALLSSLGDAPTLYVENAAEITAWLNGVRGVEEHATLARSVEERLEAAPGQLLREGRAELLATGALEDAQAAAKQHPRDQGLIAAVARLHRNQGNLKGALSLLESLGPPGRLGADAQVVLALCWADAGRTLEAEELLAHYIDRWLPRFRSARTEYARRAEKLENKHVADARAGTLPMGISKRLEGAQNDDSKQQALFSEWLEEQLSSDPELLRLREEYSRHSGVVSASLALGSLRLERAGGLEGAERERLLGLAEQAFVAVQAEAEGSIDFHLGMGQVLHRLGKPDDGDRHLQALIDRNEPQTSLDVASVYRELGLLQRGRKTAEAVFNAQTGPLRDRAASLLSVMATNLQDQEKWLGRISEETPELRAKRAQLKGLLLAREGKVEEADREYLKALAHHERASASESASANNAALIHGLRHTLTGEPSHLEKAVLGYTRALRLSPENAIILGNLAHHLALRAELAVLDPYLQTKVLKLDESEASALVRYLLVSEEHDRVQRLMTGQGHLRRLLDTSRKQEIVAPNNADPYATAKTWSVALEDLAGLQALQTRLERVKVIDTTARAESLERWKSGADDDLIRQGIRARHLTLATAMASPHAATRAAALVLSSAGRSRLAELDGDLGEAERAVAELKAAHLAWPGLGADTALPLVLLEVALLKAAAADPAWGKARAEGWRLHDAGVIVQRAVARNAASADVLRAQPEFQEAAAISAALPARKLGMLDWVLASLSGDQVTMTRVASELRSPLFQLSEALSARLSPGQGQQARSALFRRIVGAEATALEVP